MPSISRRTLFKYFVPSMLPSLLIEASANVSQPRENDGDLERTIKNNKVIYVKTIDELRMLEPQSDGQIVYLSIRNIDGQLINDGFLFSDKNDKESLDDGFLNFVTAKNNRWKRSLSEGLNLSWFGLFNGGDISKPWMKAIEYIIECLRSVGNKGLPRIIINAGEYIVKETIYIPPFISTVFNGKIILHVTSEFSGDESVLWIKGVSKFRPYTDGRILTLAGAGGEMHINGGHDRKLTGLKIGNTDSDNYFTNRTGECPCYISNINITGFDTGVGFTGYDCYLIHFDSVTSSINNTNIATLDNKNINSGERISFSNCNFFGGGRRNGHLYIDNKQFDLQFSNCSFDYSSTDFLKFGEYASWSTVKFNQCHFEGVENYIINASSPRTSPVNVKFNDCSFLPTGRYGSKISNSPSRKLFLLGNGCYCEINGLDLRVTEYPTDRNILMCESDRLVVTSITRVIYPVIPSLAHIKNRNFNFENEHIGSIFNKEKSIDSYYCSYNDNVYGVIERDVENKSMLKLKINNTTERGSIKFGIKESLPICTRRIYTSTISIGFSSVQNITVVHFMSWFDIENRIISVEKYEYSLNKPLQKIAFNNVDSKIQKVVPTISKYWSPPAGAVYLKVDASISNLKNDISIVSFFVGEI
ncbi:TPA: hypothetical protein OUC36_001442 [Raoultella ornithinolytica]|nr:hypothetical protein [Raoultella ornithinolytica]